MTTAEPASPDAPATATPTTPPLTPTPARTPDPAPAPQDERWRTALHQVLREPAALTLHTQPLVELSSGAVAGYEALSRFDSARLEGVGFSAGPDRWFAAAEHWGVNAQLQARVLTTAVAMRTVLPPDTLLTVNVEPHLLTDPLVAGTLLEHADLTRLVVELTEHSVASDPAALHAVLDRLRQRGALIAMDDAGTGYAGLSQLLSLRPHVVKLDRELIAGIDADPVKRALTEVIGDLVGRMDGWVLAEGIETLAELDTVVALGVALGQGYALARPAPVMLPQLDEALVARVQRGAARAQLQEHVLSLVREARVGTDAATSEVLLGPDGRVRAVRVGGSAPDDPVRWCTPLLVAPSASLVEVARRAATRHAADLSAPLVCTDGRGAVVGVVTHADLLLALARTR
ncbi:EAL domain-containing protein [Kineococcus indalonis]|uniref:EAL domain-containing protein n=1 Tax=Kineococcus indalonis TaxID=2696566 RepID=UPI0014133CF6|nr:EAL domain-containing protein [Kineococcus indalonis]NAZ84980.1 EAL domain-containing protein [Kineococcus indalonis]